MKTNKYMRLLSVVLCFVLIGGTFAACGKSSPAENSQKNAVVNENSQKDPKKVTEVFVQHLLKNSLNNLSSFFNLPENAVITNDDIVWAVEREKYGELIGKEYEIKDVTVETGSTTGKTQTATVTLEEKTSKGETLTMSYSFSLMMNDDNTYSIKNPSSFVNYQIGVPAGTSLTVNGVPVAFDEKFDYTESNQDVYAIYCASKPTIFTVTTSNLGAFEKEITPTATSTPEMYMLDVTNETVVKDLMNQAQSDINEIADLYVNNRLDTATLSKYFTSDFTSEDAEAVLQQLKKGFKASTYTYKSITLSNLKQTQGTRSYIWRDDIITLNFTTTVVKPNAGYSALDRTDEGVSFYIRYQRQPDGTWKIADYSKELFAFPSYSNDSVGGVGVDGFYKDTFDKKS